MSLDIIFIVVIMMFIFILNAYMITVESIVVVLFYIITL